MLRITTLSDNTAGLGGFLAEWGLSIMIEKDNLSVLFDCGQSISAACNADILGINLAQTESIILSHGHYDHTGGLFHVLRKMHKNIDVIAHPDIWAAKYSHRKGQDSRYIGIPHCREELESMGARFTLSREPVNITDNIVTTGEIPMVNDYEDIATNLQVKTAGSFQQDSLMDDQALIIKTGAGLVIILGCAHRGVINTIHHARQITGIDKIHAVMGGCHLISASEERLKRTIEALKETGVQRLGVSHCTGLHAAGVMAREFGDRFFYNTAGTVIELP